MDKENAILKRLSDTALSMKETIGDDDGEYDISKLEEGIFESEAFDISNEEISKVRHDIGNANTSTKDKLSVIIGYLNRRYNRIIALKSALGSASYKGEASEIINSIWKSNGKLNITEELKNVTDDKEMSRYFSFQDDKSKERNQDFVSAISVKTMIG